MDLLIKIDSETSLLKIPTTADEMSSSTSSNANGTVCILNRIVLDVVMDLTVVKRFFGLGGGKEVF